MSASESNMPSMPSREHTDVIPVDGTQYQQKSERLQTRPIERPNGRMSDSIQARFGSHIGGYLLEGELGRGGMGIVFRATDPDLKRPVALKILINGASAGVDELVRFRGEAELVAKLQHPNIVQIYEIGQHDQMPFLALEFIDGGTLAGKIAGQPQLPKQAAEWAETIARALHVAHAEGIIHRDLKPANILISKSGLLKVTDFGLAKNLESSMGVSRDGQVMGTPSYMAPEQAFGSTSQISPRTDVYAIGAIFYELLTGRPPFRGATILDTLEQVRHVDPTSPSRLVPKLPPELCTICLKCLEKSPERRYGTTLELADDLRRWLDGEKILARPLPLWKRTVRTIRRRPALAAKVIIGLLLGGMLALGWVFLRERDLQTQVALEQEKLRALEAEAQKKRGALFTRAGDALDGILDKLTKDEKISRITDLEPLHDELYQFYDRLTEDTSADGELDAAQQERLARVFNRLGQLTDRSGRKGIALRSFLKSAAFYAKIADREQAGERPTRDHAGVLMAVATIYFRDLQEIARGREFLLQARAALEKWSADHPQDLLAVNALAETYHLEGEILGLENKPAQASAAYKRAIALRDPLRPKHGSEPQFKRDLARDFGYLGDEELKLHQISQADSSYWESHRLRGGDLPREKLTDPEARFQLARSFGNLASVQLKQRFFDTAISFARQSYEILLQLVQDDKADKRWAAELATREVWLADLYLQKVALLGQQPQLRTQALLEAQQYLKSAQQRADHLHQFDAQRKDVRQARTDARLQMARWHLLQEPPQLTEAAQAAGEARKGYLDLARASHDGDLYYSLACAHAMELEAAQAPSPPLRQKVFEFLQKASAENLQLHPQTIQEDRALRALQQDSEFLRWLQDYQRLHAFPSQPNPGPATR